MNIIHYIMKSKPYKKAYLILESVDCYYGNHNSHIVYAETGAKAKSKLIRDSEGTILWSEIMNLRCTRRKEDDLYKQEMHKLLIGLSDKQISHLTHSLGVEVNDTIPKDWYRNYSFYYNKNKECDELVRLGLMTNHQKLGSEIYSVSVIGMEAVKTLLLKKN